MLGFSDLENLWINAGGPQDSAPTMAAIAMAESGGNPGAINPGTPQVPEYSVGLWQINLNAHPQYTAQDMQDPAKNAQAALEVSNRGTNFNPWSTFTNGAFRQYLNGNPASGNTGGSTGGISTIGNKVTGDCTTFKVTLPWGGGDFCFDPIVGILAMAGGGVLLIGGVAVLVAFALKETAAGRTATRAVGYMPNPVGAAVSVAAKRSEAKAATAKQSETAQRTAVVQGQRDAMHRSRLRVTRARARTAEGKAKAARGGDVAASASRKAASGKFADFSESETQWAEKNPDAFRAAIKGASIKA